MPKNMAVFQNFIFFILSAIQSPFIVLIMDSRIFRQENSHCVPRWFDMKQESFNEYLDFFTFLIDGLSTFLFF